MALDADHRIGESGHVDDHNLIDVALAAKADASALAAKADVSALAEKLDVTTASATYALQATPLAPSSRTVSAAPPTVISALQAGHAFVGDGTGGTTELNDTTTFLAGTQSARRTSNGAGGNASLSRVGAAPFDLTGRYLRVWLRFDDVSRINLITVFAASNNFANGYRWDALSNTVADQTLFTNGEFVCLSLPFQDANVLGTPVRNAITDLRVTVTDKSSGAVTYNLGRVETVPDPTPFPNGVVSFTFDDGYASQFTAGLPALSRYGYKGTAYVIDDLIGIGDPAYMSMEQLRTLHDVHGWEVGGHAHTVANHNAGFDSLTPAALEEELRLHKQWLVANGFRAPGRDHFAIPRGLYSAATLAGIRRYFASARSTVLRLKETAPPGDVYRMRTRQLGNGITLATAQGEITKAFNTKSWYIITAHQFAATASSSQTWATSDFNALVDSVAASGVAVRTVGEVLAAQF